MKWLLTGLVLLVIVLHQDSWFWTDKTLVFGFIPIGLAYHIGYAFVASATLALLVKFAWPRELESYEALPAPAGESEGSA